MNHNVFNTHTHTHTDTGCKVLVMVVVLLAIILLSVFTVLWYVRIAPVSRTDHLYISNHEVLKIDTQWYGREGRGEGRQREGKGRGGRNSEGSHPFSSALSLSGGRP